MVALAPLPSVRYNDRMSRFREQYDPGMPQGDLPDEITSPEGYWWHWTDADKKGVPGYQCLGAGPAYERTYVEQALYCLSVDSDRPCPIPSHPHYELASRRR